MRIRRSPPSPANSVAIGPSLSRDNHLKKQQQQHIVYILFSPQSAENVPLYASNSVAYVSVKLLAAFFCVGANLSLRKHLLLLALRRWGRFARRFPAAKSEEKRMFSQAKLTCKTGGL